MYHIQEPDGSELHIGFVYRKAILEIWQTQERLGVPLYHVVRNDLALVANMTHGTRAVANPSPDDFERAVGLVKNLPPNAPAASLTGLFYKLRACGYKLILLDENGDWRVLDSDKKRSLIGEMHRALLRLAQGELTITRPRDPELSTGFGRILKRDKPQPPPEPDEAETPPSAQDPVDQSLLVYRMQQAAQTAQEQGVQQQVIEHGGYVVSISRVAYDPAAEVRPCDIRAKITAEAIHEHLLGLARDGRHRTLDECIWDLLGAPVPLDSLAFREARKRFSTARSVAENELQNAGYRPGEWHDRMAPVPNTRHRSKVIHWIRGTPA